jgi:hypothetical protein
VEKVLLPEADIPVRKVGAVCQVHAVEDIPAEVVLAEVADPKVVHPAPDKSEKPVVNSQKKLGNEKYPDLSIGRTQPSIVVAK